MKNKTTLLFTALLCTLLVFSPRVILANGDNPLRDASFELQLPPEKGGWILFDESRFSSREARSGSRSMFNWGFSRNVPAPPFLLGTASGSYQEFPAVAGSRWRLTGHGMTPSKIRGAPAFGIVQLSFFDSRGNDLGTVETDGDKTTRARTSNQVNSQAPVGEWIFLDTGIATAPAGTATVQAFTLFVDYSAANISQGVYFDDLILCALDDDDKDGSSCQ
jgi:hypothetical protein